MPSTNPKQGAQPDQPGSSADYIEFRFVPQSADLTEALLGLLSELPFNAFEERDDALLAWVAPQDYQAEALSARLQRVAQIIPFSFSQRIVPTENWNAIWESNFEAVRVSPGIGIRAPFHPPFEEGVFELVIEPKMSFGTGHHPTTRLMLQLMEEHAFEQKSVLDIGTGTGILAIYAALRGASGVSAFDNHAWSVENARENARRNGASLIDIRQSDMDYLSTFAQGPKADFVLANINRIIITQYLDQMRQCLRPNGVLMLSGLLSDDGPELIRLAESHTLSLKNSLSEKGWIALLFTA